MENGLEVGTEGGLKGRRKMQPRTRESGLGPKGRVVIFLS